MIRAIILSLIVNTVCFAQTNTLHLEYEQIILVDKVLKENSSRSGFMNTFSPVFIDGVEKVLNTKSSVQIHNDSIIVKTQLAGENENFSAKYQTDKELYYLNLLTGEKKLSNPKNRLYSIQKLRVNLKEKKYKEGDFDNCEIKYYTARIETKKMELKVCSNIKSDNKYGLFDEYFYNGMLIKEQRIIDEEKNEEQIRNLISIADKVEFNFKNEINKSTALILANRNLTTDSIQLNKPFADIYFKDISKDEIVSLNSYKGNGKFLLVDFWGTWCKPCLASIPELKTFYEKYSEKIDLISMNYKDSNLRLVKNKINETGMYWTQGIATEKVNKVLNPDSYFPGIIVFDDEMKLIIRDKASNAIELAELILKK